MEIDLTLESFEQVVLHRQPVCWSRMRGSAWRRAREVVDALVAGDRVAYAITTGVGHLADVRISADQALELQINLVRSHAVGVGDPLSEAGVTGDDAAARQLAGQRATAGCARR